MFWFQSWFQVISWVIEQWFSRVTQSLVRIICQSPLEWQNRYSCQAIYCCIYNLFLLCLKHIDENSHHPVALSLLVMVDQKVLWSIHILWPHFYQSASDTSPREWCENQLFKIIFFIKSSKHYYLINTAFIFGNNGLTLAAVTPVTFECDINDLTNSLSLIFSLQHQC